MATSERTIGQLVADSVDDVRAIIQHEKALAKAEISRAAKAGGIGAGLLAGAVAMLGLAAVFLLFAAAWALVEAGMTLWGAFLVVGGALLLLGVLLGAVGAVMLKKVSGPTRAVQQGKGTVEDVKEALSSDDTVAVRPSTGAGATALSSTGRPAATAGTTPRPATTASGSTGGATAVGSTGGTGHRA